MIQHKDKLPVSVLIMTQNEEANIRFAVESVLPYFDQVIIVDSYSKDGTLDILRNYPEVHVYQHAFESWAAQRNWMLGECEIRNEVVFFLDADEYIRPEFAKELKGILKSKILFSAIYVDREYVFLGRTLLHSHGHPLTLRIFRKENLSFVGEGAREYAKVNGPTITMNARYVHHDRNPISAWFRKHNNNSDREAALYLSRGKTAKDISGRNLSRAQLVKLWVRNNIWNEIPLLLRPFLYFPLRYLVTRSFLEGMAAYAYTYLHAFLYQSMIDAKILHLSALSGGCSPNEPPVPVGERLPISVLIMTQNEEANIEYALKSVVPCFDQIIIADSYSEDSTLKLVSRYPEVQVYSHHFESWSSQRNWMLKNCSIRNEIVFFLDADEYVLPDFVEELRTIIYGKKEFSSIFLRPKLVFMGKVLTYAYGHPSIRRIFKKGVRFLGAGAREYAVTEGVSIEMKSPLMHHDRKSLSYWVAKHNNNSDREAACFLEEQPGIEYSGNGSLPDRLRVTLWVRRYIWNRLPLLVRPIFYFLYRYFVKLGLCDGRPGFVYCFLHSLIYQSMIDVKILEKRNA